MALNSYSFKSEIEINRVWAGNSYRFGTHEDAQTFSDSIPKYMGARRQIVVSSDPSNAWFEAGELHRDWSVSQ